MAISAAPAQSIIEAADSITPIINPMVISKFYIHKTETNASPITTNASGAGTFSSSLRIVKSAIIQIPGYITVVTGVSGNTINFQLYQQSAATGALTAPTAAVTINAGSLLVDEWGY